MEEAWSRVKANKGAGGIDGISIQDIEAYGEETFLEEIVTELKEGNYHPKAVKRVKSIKTNKTVAESGSDGKRSHASIYLNALDTWWEKNGAEVGRLVRYADDMVIICKSYKDAERAIELLKICHLETGFNPTPNKDKYPSRKARKKMQGTIKYTIRRRERIPWTMEDLIRELNPKIIGWRNYYGVKTCRGWSPDVML